MSMMKELNTNVCYSLDFVDHDGIKADVIKDQLYNELQVYVRIDGKPVPVPSKTDTPLQNELDVSVSEGTVLELKDFAGIQVYINPLIDINEAIHILEKIVHKLKNNPPNDIWEEAYELID